MIFGLIRLAVLAHILFVGATISSSAAENCRSVQVDETVLVIGGEYLMGCSNCFFSDEQPVQRVKISDFRMAKFEITNIEFLNWLEKSNTLFPYKAELKKKATLQPCHPVEKVSWFLAERFCRAHNEGRLPTEAEWEYAASIDIGANRKKMPWNSGLLFPPLRGSNGDSDSFSNGLSEDDYEGLSDDEMEKRIEAELQVLDSAGRKRLSPNLVKVQDTFKGLNGIHGLMGSLWEWTVDWYGPYSSKIKSNPETERVSSYKVIRGGSYQNIHQKQLMHPTARNKAKPDMHLLHVGFRCVWPKNK